MISVLCTMIQVQGGRSESSLKSYDIPDEDRLLFPIPVPHFCCSWVLDCDKNISDDTYYKCLSWFCLLYHSYLLHGA
jgi:hypothetical protein